jgi:hypothetical protein
MTLLRIGFVAMAVFALGVGACTQGTTPNCADEMCGPGPVPVDASMESEAEASTGD